MDDEVTSLQCNMFSPRSDVGLKIWHIYDLHMLSQASFTLRPVLKRASCAIDKRILVGQLDIVPTRKSIDRLIKFLTDLITSKIYSQKNCIIVKI